MKIVAAVGSAAATTASTIGTLATRMAGVLEVITTADNTAAGAAMGVGAAGRMAGTMEPVLGGDEPAAAAAALDDDGLVGAPL